MAQTSKVNALIGDLANSFAKAAGEDNPKKLRQSKDAAIKSAKAHQYVRTNQFEVDSTLNGLIEKFSIINRDDLAGALAKRLDELKTRSRSKWTPEVLSLFLNLADRPDQKASLEALELLKPPSPPPSPVTWEELDKEESLRGDVWLDESYSSASEDELEAAETFKSEYKARFAAATIADEDHAPIVTEICSAKAFTDLKSSQFWTQTDLRSSRPQLLFELEVIREVLLMLRGLPTSLFAIDEKNVLIYHATNVMLSQISLSGLNDVLQSFASMASDLFRLRTWAQRQQSVPLLQTFNSAVCDRLRDFDREVTEIEQGFIQPQQKSVIVSVLQLHQDIESLSRPMTALSSLATSVPASGGDFICLELLYDQLCSLQAAGDEQCFTMLGQIFFECLNVYLRPVALWVEQGAILENDESFFIAFADKGSGLSSLWHERFTLRMTNDGTLHAPKFLLPAAKKILNAGKSIVFLQSLRKDVPEPTKTKQSSLVSFDAIVRPYTRTLPLIPFSELFSASFSTWMNSKYGPASSILKQHLFDSGDLLRQIDTLEHIYFSKDGVLFQSFADELLKRMTNRRAGWNDNFLLTELARRTFGSIEGLKAGSLSVRTNATKHASTRSVKVLTSLVLDINLPWPVQNIIQRSSMPIYQAIFTLLLQIYRVKFLLRFENFNIRRLGAGTSRLAIGTRQQLMWFANVMHSYVLETVVQIAIGKLREQLIAAEDVDAMCEMHEKFVARLELSCLLARNLAPIYDSIISILDLAVVHAETQAALSDRNWEHVRAKSLRTSAPKRGRKRQCPEDGGDVDEDESTSESESSEEGEEGQAVPEAAAHDSSPGDRLQSIRDQFSQLLHFTVAGLRGVSRARGQAEWEMLAERLEWGLQKRKRAMDYEFEIHEEDLLFDERECYICKEVIGQHHKDGTTEEPTTTTCGHCIGASCLQDWFKFGKDCPMCGEPFIDQLITNDNGNDQDAREYEELSEEYLKHMREQEWLLERLGAECDDDEVEEEKPDVDVFFDNFDQQKLTEAEQAARVHTFIIYFVTYSMRRLGIPPEVPRLTELTKFADWAVQTMQFLVAMLELPEVVIIIVDLMRDVMFGPGQAEFVDELMSVQAGAEGIREALDGARDAQPQEEVNVGWVPYPQRHSA